MPGMPRRSDSNSMKPKQGSQHLPRSCPECKRQVRVLNERDAVVFYICDHCGLRGAYSVPERPS